MTLTKSSDPVKVVQTLARHSTPTLTLGVYSHVGLHHQAGALAALPDLDAPRPASERMAATGTDGPIRPQDFAPNLLRAGDATSRPESPADMIDGGSPPRSMAIGAGLKS